MKKAEEKDFCKQIVEFFSGHREAFATAGFDCTSYLTTLHEQHFEWQKAQLEAKNKAKEASAKADEALHTFYNEVSAMTEMARGILGSDNELVKELDKLRKHC